MLRRANESDRERLLEYLGREPEFNLFIIGDILNLGMSGEGLDYFVEEHRGLCRSVLMRYRDALIPWTHDDTLDLCAVAERVNTHLDSPGPWTVHGKADIIDRLKPLLSRAPENDRETFFCSCRHPDAEIPLEQLPLARLATPDDTDEVGGVLASVPEFRRKEYSHLRGEVEKGQTTISCIRDPESGRMVSTAAYVAESDQAAMIIGVATLEAERGKGYASACVYRLVEDLEKKGKSACLFFDNPAAGRIYHRLGFNGIGTWRMLRYEN